MYNLFRMKKYYLNLIGKVLFFSLIFTSFYYFLFLKPEIQTQKDLSLTENTLNADLTNLVQNRISYIELTRLDTKSINFQTEIANITKEIRETQNKGLELINNKNSLPPIKNIEINFPVIMEETESVYIKQKELIGRVMQTKSYEEGLKVLTSDEAVSLLTKQTNLISEYRFWLEKIENY